MVHFTIPDWFQQHCYHGIYNPEANTVWERSSCKVYSHALGHAKKCDGAFDIPLPYIYPHGRSLCDAHVADIESKRAPSSKVSIVLQYHVLADKRDSPPSSCAIQWARTDSHLCAEPKRGQGMALLETTLYQFPQN